MKDRTDWLILSPHYAPMKTGLADYTRLFQDELSKHKRVTVLTSRGNLETTGVLPLVDRWSFRSLRKIFDQKDLYRADCVLVEYVPFMYGRAGINFSFCFFLVYLALVRKSEIHVMVHEVNYPLQANVKSVIMFFSHVLMMFLLMIAARKLFVSTAYFYHQLRDRFRCAPEKLFRLPVGSNLPRIISGGDSHVQPRLCLFGTLHPAKEVPWVLRNLLELHRKGVKFEVIYIGENEERILGLFSASEQNEIKHLIKVLGFLSDEDASRAMSGCDALVCYFVDGLSTRRGTAMAALKHGLKLITTLGPYTDPEFKGLDFVHLLPLERKRFLEELELLLQTGDIHRDPERISAFYENHFSWPRIIHDYLRFVET